MLKDTVKKGAVVIYIDCGIFPEREFVVKKSIFGDVIGKKVTGFDRGLFDKDNLKPLATLIDQHLACAENAVVQIIFFNFGDGLLQIAENFNALKSLLTNPKSGLNFMWKHERDPKNYNEFVLELTVRTGIA